MTARARAVRSTAHLPGSYAALGYRAAEVARTSGRALPTSGGADRHLREDRELLVRMGTQFARDNSIYQGIVNRAAEGILGVEGFTLQARTKSSRVNQILESGWREFAESPEIRGLFSFRECERNALLGVWNQGDIGVALLDEEQKIQHFESEQIWSRKSVGSKPNGRYLVDGVELDEFARPINYFVRGYDQYGQLRVADSTPIPAADFLLPANRDRFSQTRGVPVLTPAFSMLHRINDVCDAEAIAWQLLSRFAVAVNRENGAAAAFAESSADEDGRDAPADLADRVVELDSAIMFHGELGETISAIPRDLPGANFGESVRMYLRLIGMPVGMPLELILLDWSKTNYTASRATLEQAFRIFVRWQRFLKRQYHRPIYRRWVSWKVAEGLVPDRSDVYEHDWHAPEFPWIDQRAEAEAWGTRMDRGLATQTAALQSVGMDRADYLSARATEITEAMAKAREINAANSDQPPVDWRMLVGIPVGTTEMAVRAGSEEVEADDAD